MHNIQVSTRAQPEDKAVQVAINPMAKCYLYHITSSVMPVIGQSVGYIR